MRLYLALPVAHGMGTKKEPLCPAALGVFAVDR